MPSISVRAISSREPAPRSTDIPVELVVAGSLCLFVSIASVCARLFTKIVDLRRVHADDCKHAINKFQMYTNWYRFNSQRRSMLKAPNQSDYAKLIRLASYRLLPFYLSAQATGWVRTSGKSQHPLSSVRCFTQMCSMFYTPRPCSPPSLPSLFKSIDYSREPGGRSYIGVHGFWPH